MERSSFSTTKSSNRYLPFKRLLDVVFSTLLLIFLALPMAVIACLIAVSSRGGVIFRQTRIGRDGRPFTCYKFRTMVYHAPPNLPTAVFTDAARYITPVGRVLRRTSLDELPQLVNVLRGDMSLVGPRPLIDEERSMHRLREKNGVYRVRPGMTGLAQIMGRDRLRDYEKAAYDICYVEKLCLWQDVKIIVRTLGRVLSGENIK